MSEGKDIKGKALSLAGMAEYSKGSVVSTTLISYTTSMSLFQPIWRGVLIW